MANRRTQSRSVSRTSAVSVDGPAAVTDPSVGLSRQGIAALVEDFLANHTPIASALAAKLQRSGTGVRLGAVRSEHILAAPLVAAMVRNHPAFAKYGDADVIDAGVVDLHASRRLGTALRELASQVEDAGDLSFDAGWTHAATVLAVTRRAARKDKTVAEAIAPAREALGRGPRAASTALAAATAHHKAAVASARASRAQEKAAAATVRAADAARRARERKGLPETDGNGGDQGMSGNGG